MSRSVSRYLSLALLGLFLCASSMPAVASPGSTDSDTEVLAAREAVATTLAEHGLTTEEIESRLAQLSDEDVIHFAANLDQIQTAGEEIPEYMWWLGAGLLGVLILAVIL